MKHATQHDGHTDLGGVWDMEMMDDRTKNGQRLKLATSANGHQKNKKIKITKKVVNFSKH